MNTYQVETYKRASHEYGYYELGPMYQYDWWQGWQQNILYEALVVEGSALDKSLLSAVAPVLVPLALRREQPEGFFTSLVGEKLYNMVDLLKDYSRKVAPNPMDPQPLIDSEFITKMYVDNVKALESDEELHKRVEHFYSPQYAQRNHPEVMVLVALRRALVQTEVILPHNLRAILNQEVAFGLSDKLVLEGLNKLETHWVRVKDRLEEESYTRKLAPRPEAYFQRKEPSVVAEAKAKLGEDWDRPKERKQPQEKNRGVRL